MFPLSTLPNEHPVSGRRAAVAERRRRREGTVVIFTVTISDKFLLGWTARSTDRFVQADLVEVWTTDASSVSVMPLLTDIEQETKDVTVYSARAVFRR
jgi:hypothetical protein